MKKLRELKSKKGFTLVELIIVIVIIAILAAIAIPAMIAYINDARQSRDRANYRMILGAAGAAAGALEAELRTGTFVDEITRLLGDVGRDITVTGTGNTATIAINGIATNYVATYTPDPAGGAPTVTVTGPGQTPTSP